MDDQTDRRPHDLTLGGDAPEPRPVARSIRRGVFNRCPNCGEGRLFSGFLRSVDQCAVCGEQLDHHRADDFPPYIVIFVIGHIVVAGYLATELTLTLSSWGQLAIWVPVAIVLSLLLMQPAKGGVIGLQWALRMHGFSGEDDQPADLLSPRDDAR